jgi:hypothetical protein
MKRLFLSGSFLLIAMFAMPPSAAQSVNQQDFLSDPSAFPDIHGMPGAYLKQKAFALLDERARVVTRISTRANLTTRQQYVRERVWSYLCGQPHGLP